VTVDFAGGARMRECENAAVIGKAPDRGGHDGEAE
jgi:hypothetical protein